MGKIIGILGGMGPLATVAFEEALLRASGATRDRDYPILITLNDGTMPDRTEALLRGGTSPVPKMIEGIGLLRRMGAEVICMPCNTAHAFAHELTAALDGVVFVHIVEAVLAYLREEHPSVTSVGVLCTTGARAGQAYDRVLMPEGIAVIYPDPSRQDDVMDAIYGPLGVKSGYLKEPRMQLSPIVDHMKTLGVNAVVLGCTELPLALKEASLPLIDSNVALARAVLRAAMN